MIAHKDSYLQFIKENIASAESLANDIEYWQIIYKKRIFDGKWPADIQNLINALRLNIKQEIEECLYYIKRIKEMRENELSCPTQLRQDQNNVDVKGAGPGDTDKDLAVIESEDLGFTPEEADDNWSEDIKR